MNTDAIVRRAWSEFEPHLQEQGYELVEVEYGGGSRNRILRLFIDKEDGITLDDCSAAAQLLNPLLDVGEFIDAKYTLEVSSPGVSRPLRKPADFEKYAGDAVRVSTHAPSGGRRKFKGTLQGIRDGLVVLECDGQECEIHIENVKKANLER